MLTGTGLVGIESEQVRENIQKDGDNTDMSAGGYFVSDSGGIYQECMSNYMDLEYYDKELTGGERVLVPLSNFLKGRISPDLYARAYYQILMEEHARMCMPKDYLKGELILAGLEKAEHVKLWLDNIREAPEGYTPCKSVNEAKKIITGWERDGAVIDVIDCDHDLGDYASDGGDGIALLDWLVERETFYPIRLHTMNPVGRENMQREIDRYWKKENL